MRKLVFLAVAMTTGILLLLATVAPAFAGGTSINNTCVAPQSSEATWTLTANGNTGGGSLTIASCNGSTITLGGGP